MDYDENNIFARIMRGELPSEQVYEDDATLVIMDIMPRAPGHMLVLPKAPVRNLLDAEPDQLAACMATAKKVAAAAKKAFNADGITLQQFSEAAGGQEVFHLHFHVVPRMECKRMKPAGSGDMEKTRGAAGPRRANSRRTLGKRRAATPVGAGNCGAGFPAWTQVARNASHTCDPCERTDMRDLIALMQT